LIEGDGYLPSPFINVEWGWLTSIREGQSTPGDCQPHKSGRPGENMLDYPKPTPRQLQILELFANGFTTRQIGLELHIANQTVKNHLSSMRDRMEIDTTYQAIAIAVQNKWISVDERLKPSTMA